MRNLKISGLLIIIAILLAIIAVQSTSSERRQKAYSDNHDQVLQSLRFYPGDWERDSANYWSWHNPKLGYRIYAPQKVIENRLDMLLISQGADREKILIHRGHNVELYRYDHPMPLTCSDRIDLYDQIRELERVHENQQ